jgi:hypothetical protein
MVSHDKNAHDIADSTKQEMVGKALHVHAAEIALANSERLRSLGGLLHVMSQFGVKLVRELARCNSLIISHDLVDIRINLRM